VAAYVDRSARWGPAFMGDEILSAANASGPDPVEVFAASLGFATMGFPDIAWEAASDVTVEFPGGGSQARGIGYRLEVLALGGGVVVPAGTLGPTVELQPTIGRQFMGERDLPSDMWLHPEQFRVKLSHAPASESIELVTLWGGSQQPNSTASGAGAPSAFPPSVPRRPPCNRPTSPRARSLHPTPADSPLPWTSAEAGAGEAPVGPSGGPPATS